MGQRGGPNRAEFWLYKGVADKLVPNVVNYSTVPRHVLKYVTRKSNRAAEPQGEMRHFTQQCHLRAILGTCAAAGCFEKTEALVCRNHQTRPQAKFEVIKHNHGRVIVPGNIARMEYRKDQMVVEIR